MSHGRNYDRRFCSYKGCNSDLLTTRDGAISFFSFPVKDTERCSAWITNSGREEFRYLTPKELAEKRICELHFQNSMFSNFFKTNLKKHAVPTSSNNRPAPELIQIDIDDDSDNECEVTAVSENSSTTRINSDHRHSANTNSESVSAGTHEVPCVDGSILSAVLNGNPPVTEVSCQTLSLTEAVPANNNQSPSITSTHRNAPHNSDLEEIDDEAINILKKTKFHNLPPETTHTDFYFQHCADFGEEANTNSMPEPPDGELPLFVQQNSVVSGGIDEHANSDIMMEPPHKRRRRVRDGDDDDLPDQMRSIVKHLKTLTGEDDEFELFGRSVALQLKKMTLCTALSVQAKIQNLLSQHRIEDIKREARLSKATNKSSEGCGEGNEKEEMEGEEKKDNVNSTEEENLETTGSPQLSLFCASEHSDNEAGQ